MPAYPSLHLSLRGVDLSTYVILSFCTSFRSFHLPTNRFSFFFTKVFLLLPPGSCHPFFTFLYPCHLPDLLQPAFFSACLLSVLPLLSVVVRVSWTDAVCGRSFALLTHGQHHTRTQTIKHGCGVLCSPRPGLVSQRTSCPSAFLPPPFPVVVETINPTALSPLSRGDHRSPTWTPCTAVDIKQSHEPCC